MIVLRPTVEEERRLAIAGRARGWKRSGWITAVQLAEIRSLLAGPWQGGTFFSRIAFFFLTLIAVGAFFGILHLARLPFRGVVTVIVCCGLAELLINKKRFYHSGVEEALYLGGLFALIFALPGPARDEGLLLFAAASLIAGWRVLNPWFVVLGAVFAVAYVYARFDELAGGNCATVLGVAALLLLSVSFRRPFHTDVVAGMAVISPLLVWLPGILLNELGVWPLLLFVIFIVAAVVTFFGRLHAALLTALVAGALLGYEFSQNFKWPGEIKLMLGGAATFAAAVFLERFLRTDRRGFTSRKALDRDMNLFDALAVPVAAQGAMPSAPEAQRSQGEGGFGGAGASGEY